MRVTATETDSSKILRSVEVLPYHKHKYTLFCALFLLIITLIAMKKDKSLYIHLILLLITMVNYVSHCSWPHLVVELSSLGKQMAITAFLSVVCPGGVPCMK